VKKMDTELLWKIFHPKVSMLLIAALFPPKIPPFSSLFSIYLPLNPSSSLSSSSSSSSSSLYPSYIYCGDCVFSTLFSEYFYSFFCSLKNNSGKRKQHTSAASSSSKRGRRMRGLFLRFVFVVLASSVSASASSSNANPTYPSLPLYSPSPSSPSHSPYLYPSVSPVIKRNSNPKQEIDDYSSETEPLRMLNNTNTNANTPIISHNANNAINDLPSVKLQKQERQDQQQEKDIDNFLPSTGGAKL
jgi:hypothetical protein